MDDDLPDMLVDNRLRQFGDIHVLLRQCNECVQIGACKPVVGNFGDAAVLHVYVQIRKTQADRMTNAFQKILQILNLYCIIKKTGGNAHWTSYG